MSDKRETLGFQTEVRQLLKLMIHSLYSNKEIFLRELISNASDAADKLRFEALASPELLADDTDLGISIEVDKDKRTLSVTDNGIGMSRDELIENLGTIAKSGTAEFLQQMTGDKQHDANLIGQFGVGFYSTFIVADKVSVESRRAGLDADAAVRWESEGEGEFTIENITREERGTRVTLHLKENESEFAESFRIESQERNLLWYAESLPAAHVHLRQFRRCRSSPTEPKNEVTLHDGSHDRFVCDISPRRRQSDQEG